MIAACYHRIMGQILIRNLDDGTIDTLKRRAKAASSSLEAEARAAITRGVQLTREEKRVLLDEMMEEGRRAMVPGVPQTEGWILINEGRDQR